eukprot:gene3882-4843_t
MNTSTTEDMVPADPRIAGRRGEQQVIEIENVKTAWRKWYQKELEGVAHPGEFTGTGSLSDSQDPWALPEGPVLHTIFGTGGDPAVQHDREWNLVPDPPAVDYQ